MNPTSVELLQQRREVLIKLKRYEEYIECLDEIILLNPSQENYRIKSKII